MIKQVGAIRLPDNIDQEIFVSLTNVLEINDFQM